MSIYFPNLCFYFSEICNGSANKEPALLTIDSQQGIVFPLSKGEVNQMFHGTRK